MVFNKPHLIVCGGNDGQRLLMDVYILDVELPPFIWTEVRVKNQTSGKDNMPCPRVYHS